MVIKSQGGDWRSLFRLRRSSFTLTLWNVKCELGKLSIFPRMRKASTNVYILIFESWEEILNLLRKSRKVSRKWRNDSYNMFDVREDILIKLEGEINRFSQLLARYTRVVQSSCLQAYKSSEMRMEMMGKSKNFERPKIYLLTISSSSVFTLFCTRFMLMWSHEKKVGEKARQFVFS